MKRHLKYTQNDSVKLRRCTLPSFRHVFMAIYTAFQELFEFECNVML